MHSTTSAPDLPDQPLRASEARLHEAQRVGRMGDWELDRKTGVMSWSPQLFRLFERPFELGPPDLNEVMGYYTSESVDLTRDAFWEAIDSGERGELEQTVRLPSGAECIHATTIIPVKDASGRVFKLYGTTQDITERKRAEQELRRKTAEIEDLYENAPCGYHSFDADGRILRINATQLRWLGYTAEEVVGNMTVHDLLTPSSRPLFGQVFRGFKRSGVLRNMEIELRRKDGKALPALMSATALFDGEGRFIAGRTVVSDNSDRKQLELERAAHAARQAESSRHMVEVQERERRKLATALHDRASPNLAALQLTLSNLSRSLPPEQRNELQPLLDDADALLRDTTADIRDICTDLRPATLDYAGLIPALEDYAQQFSQRAGLHVELETSGLRTPLAPDMQSLLFRIVQEALTNCAKHASARTARVRLANTHAELRLEISDDGVGFDPAQLASRKGPGLGLITMRERAEFAGGQFALHSAPGTGTRILIGFRSPPIGRAIWEPPAALEVRNS